MKLKIPTKNIRISTYFVLYKQYRKLNKLLNVDVEQCEYFNLDLNVQNPLNSLDLITVAFNNPCILGHQIKKIKKNVLDKNCTHIIADNSSDSSRREAIKDICKQEEIAYVGLPRHELYESNSHAAALNWVYYHLVLKRRPRWVGFLDHDIFPLCPIKIENYLSHQAFYGRREIRQNFWYLWAGFMFFELEKIQSLKIDFNPTKANKRVNLDSGGAMWHILYNQENTGNYSFAKNIRFGLNQIGYNVPDEIEYIDDCWFHSTNASLWREMPDLTGVIDRIVEDERIYTVRRKE